MQPGWHRRFQRRPDLRRHLRQARRTPPRSQTGGGPCRWTSLLLPGWFWPEQRTFSAEQKAGWALRWHRAVCLAQSGWLSPPCALPVAQPLWLRLGFHQNCASSAGFSALVASELEAPPGVRRESTEQRSRKAPTWRTHGMMKRNGISRGATYTTGHIGMQRKTPDLVHRKNTIRRKAGRCFKRSHSWISDASSCDWKMPKLTLCSQQQFPPWPIRRLAPLRQWQLQHPPTR